MLDISFGQICGAIAIGWMLLRVFFALRNRGVNWKRECQLLLVLVCIVVITRVVFFPMHPESGVFGYLRFDASKIVPPKVNFVPFVHMRDAYAGWLINIIGNIALFIPVGIIWPFCFKELDSIGKAVLAGAGYSLLIEISQLLFYERTSDVDDLLMNTAGVLIGALVYFAVVKVKDRPIA